MLRSSRRDTVVAMNFVSLENGMVSTLVMFCGNLDGHGNPPLYWLVTNSSVERSVAFPPMATLLLIVAALL